MKYTKAAIVVVIAAGLSWLTGCGSSASTPANPAGPVTSASPATQTAAQVAAKIGATGVKAVSPATLYASSEVDATWHGQPVDIAAFQTTQLRNSWESVARQFGPILSSGPDWAMTTG